VIFAFAANRSRFSPNRFGFSSNIQIENKRKEKLVIRLLLCTNNHRRAVTECKLCFSVRLIREFSRFLSFKLVLEDVLTLEKSCVVHCISFEASAVVCRTKEIQLFQVYRSDDNHVCWTRYHIAHRLWCILVLLFSSLYYLCSFDFLCFVSLLLSLKRVVPFSDRTRFKWITLPEDKLNNANKLFVAKLTENETRLPESDEVAHHRALNSTSTLSRYHSQCSWRCENDAAQNVQAVKRVFSSLLRSAGVKHNQWELNVMDNTSKDIVYAVPGSLVVFSGAFPIMQNESGMAFMLSCALTNVIASLCTLTCTRIRALCVRALILFRVSRGVAARVRNQQIERKIFENEAKPRENRRIEAHHRI
jgi:hypothetical protein